MFHFFHCPAQAQNFVDSEIQTNGSVQSNVHAHENALKKLYHDCLHSQTNELKTQEQNLKLLSTSLDYQVPTATEVRILNKSCMQTPIRMR